MAKKVERMEDPQFYEDIRELCKLCAKGVITIAQRYNYNPRDVSKLFIEVYTKINQTVEDSFNNN